MVQFSSFEHVTTFNLSGLHTNTEYDLVLRQRPPHTTLESDDYESTAATGSTIEHWSPAAVLSAAKTAASSECSNHLEEGLRENTVLRFPLPVYAYLFVLCLHLHLKKNKPPSAVMIFE